MALGSRVDLLETVTKAPPLREQPTSEPSEEALLVGSARAGDHTAFGRLYDRYARLVYGVLLAKVPHTHSALNNHLHLVRSACVSEARVTVFRHIFFKFLELQAKAYGRRNNVTSPPRK
jgi:hypothetical protein